MEAFLNEKLSQIAVTAAQLQYGISHVKGCPPVGSKK
jgi:hypothetical protein